MMEGDLRHAFGGVLRYEIRQGLRSPAWWLLVLNFGLPILLAAPPVDPSLSFTRRVFVPILTVLAFLLAAPLVYLVIFEREDTPWARNVFWVHLPHVGGALLAKAVAGIVLIFLAAMPILAWVLGAALFYHGWDGLRGWGQGFLLIFLPAPLIYLAMALVAMLLTTNRFAVKVLSLFLMLSLLLLHEHVSLLHLWVPLPRIYFSHVTGFHPFGRLLIWHRLFWMLLSIGIIVWALARLSWRAGRLLGMQERRWTRNTQRLGVFLVFIALIPALFFHWEKAQRFYEMEPGGKQIPVWQTSEDSCPQAYQVDVTFDLRHLQVQGLAIWQEAYAVPKLQAGLRGMPVQEGEQIRMNYQGSPRWPRPAIWCPECLSDPTLLAWHALQPYPVGWYFVEGHLFLLMTGSWHPFPGCLMERLQVRLKQVPCESCIAVTGTPEQWRSEKVWNFFWEKPPNQGPLLAVTTTYQVIEQGGKRFLFPSHTFPNQAQVELVAPYWTTLEHMEQSGLLIEEEARTLAVVDLLTYPRWSQEGLLLVPLVPMDAVSNYQRYVALTLLMGWWCQGAESCVVQFADTLSEWEQHNPLPPNISPKNADQLSQWFKLQNQNTPPKEVSVLPSLLLYAAYRLQDPVSTYQPLHIDFFGRLAGPFLAKRSPFVLNILDALYRQGSSHFWHILRVYRTTYGLRDISLAAFSRWVENDLGVMLPEPDPGSP